MVIHLTSLRLVAILPCCLPVHVRIPVLRAPASRSEALQQRLGSRHLPDEHLMVCYSNITHVSSCSCSAVALQLFPSVEQGRRCKTCTCQLSGGSRSLQRSAGTWKRHLWAQLQSPHSRPRHLGKDYRRDLKCLRVSYIPPTLPPSCSGHTSQYAIQTSTIPRRGQARRLTGLSAMPLLLFISPGIG